MPLSSYCSCPLCLSERIVSFSENGKRSFIKCESCSLVFVEPQHLPTLELERNRYEQHNNDSESSGYSEFLKNTLSILDRHNEEAAVGSTALDFGCGPSDVCGTLLQAKGYEVSRYDPFFSPDTSLLGFEYDVLVCIETAEHFHLPDKEFKLIKKLLKKDAHFVLRTEMLCDEVDFSSWWYARDFTHVSFYSEKTISWIARNLDFEIIESSGSVTLFKSL